MASSAMTTRSNTIDYAQGPNSGLPLVGGDISGQVEVDNFEAIEFTNKTLLTLMALSGDDTINLNAPDPHCWAARS